MQYILVVVLMLMSFLVTGCNSSSSDVVVNETSNQTVTVDETIRLNNCGGKASSTQTAERSFATSIEGAASLKLSYSIVEGSVTAKYGQYRNVSKSQQLTAPPATNMEFALRWTDQQWEGAVVANGQSGEYKTRVPLSVDLISSQDLGCDAIVHQPTTIAPTQQPVTDAKETLSIPFNNGNRDIQTTQSYHGVVTILVEGVGQAAGTQWTDAFYMYTDSSGHSVAPSYPKQWVLWINNNPPDKLMQSIPAYNPSHSYSFTIDAPGGPLGFRVDDGYSTDNTGAFQVTVISKK